MIGVLDDDSTTRSSRELLDDPGPQSLIVGASAARSVQGRRRVRNEDSSAQFGSVFAIADGMGGLDNGHVVSALAVDYVINTWFRALPGQPEDVVLGANRAVLAATEPGQRSGCTLSATRFTQDRLTIVHVGDSRIYRLRAGAAELLTRDHNIRSELLAAGIVPQEGLNYGPLNAVTRYLGMPETELVVDVQSIPLKSGDRIVLCTDGAFNGLSHAAFAELAAPGDVHQAAHSLTNRASNDDATAVVIDVTSTNEMVRQ